MGGTEPDGPVGAGVQDASKLDDVTLEPVDPNAGTFVGDASIIELRFGVARAQTDLESAIGQQIDTGDLAG